MEEKPKEVQIRRVEKLPEKAVKNEVIYNIEDGSFYMGIEIQEENKNGSNLEKVSV